MVGLLLAAEKRDQDARRSGCRPRPPSSSLRRYTYPSRDGASGRCVGIILYGLWFGLRAVVDESNFFHCFTHRFRCPSRRDKRCGMWAWCECRVSRATLPPRRIMTESPTDVPPTVLSALQAKATSIPDGVPAASLHPFSASSEQTVALLHALLDTTERLAHSVAQHSATVVSDSRTVALLRQQSAGQHTLHLVRTTHPPPCFSLAICLLAVVRLDSRRLSWLI